jgi:SAM-dependent methyltransferase
MALEACGRAARRWTAMEQRDGARDRLREVREFLRHLPPESLAVASMIRGGGDGTRGAAGLEEGIAQSRDFFDRAVATSEEASVALYSLGRPELLDAATMEIVELIDLWGLLGTERTILQIGCGIGRLEKVLAARVRVACGMDVSANMLRAARHRCAGLANVLLVRSAGRDLSAFRDGAFDLVYGVDSFPYMQGAGLSLVEEHMREANRILRSRGDLVIFNFSYRGDLEQDRRDVARLAEGCGFEVIVSGLQPFRRWDGVAFRLQRRE